MHRKFNLILFKDRFFFSFVDNRKFTDNSTCYNQTTGYPEGGLNYHPKI